MKHNQTTEELISELEEGLRIDEHALEQELQSQPGLIYKATSQYELYVSRRDAAKQYVDEVKAEVDLAVRSDARQQGDKITEKEIEAEVRTSLKVIKATKAYFALHELTGQFSALKDAYKARGYALNSMTDLYIANYYSDASHRSSRKAVEHDDDHMNRRAAINEGRKSLDSERRSRR